VTESLGTLPPFSFSLPSPASSPILEEIFPPLEDTIQYLPHFLLPYTHFLHPVIHLPLPSVFPDLFPLSSSPFSTSSVEFLGEIPALSSPLQSHDFEELPFIPIITHFSQHSDPPPPGAYTIGPDAVDLEDLKRVISTANPDHGIFVYLPGVPLPYLIPVNFFYRVFPRPQLPSKNCNPSSNAT